MYGQTEGEGIVAIRDKILPEPQYMSKEQFYKKCHISKATALRLIEGGLVPAIDTHKQTNRYLISYKAVDFYLADREKHPEKYGYTFRYQKGHSKDSRKKSRDLRNLLKQLLEDFPGPFSVREAAGLLGYSEKTVCGWCKENQLSAIRISRKYYIPKKYLLDFVESPSFYRINNKSELHIELLRRVSQ